jgi:hypothetical protein
MLGSSSLSVNDAGIEDRGQRASCRFEQARLLFGCHLLGAHVARGVLPLMLVREWLIHVKLSCSAIEA